MEGDRQIGLLYEASVVPALWPEALMAIAQRLDCPDASLVVRKAANGECVFLKVGGGELSPEAIALYRDHYFHYDPLAAAASLRRASGSVVLSHELVAEDERAKNPFFQELLIPNGVGHYGGWLLANGAGAFVGLSAHRRDGPIARATIARWRHICKHAVVAVELGARIAAHEVRRAHLEQVVDRAGVAWLAVGDDARPVDQSPAAEALLSRNGAIRLDGEGRITLADEVDTQRLRALVGQACRGLGGGSLRAAGADAATVIEVVPAGVARENPFSPRNSACALVFARTRRGHPPPDAAHVREALGCSRAEAEVAGALARGRSPRDIAGDRDASIATVRTQIRVLLDVTQTPSLAALAALLARL